ncbi:Pet100 [Plasmodiophora brassicae]|uniref:Uncharacterized protein n=1 Tax=Plasmodiophora brassicae TaxID=37360 RepID=A0A3P3YB19_PLABS|nr:unnamed protein product [Plasmodiophora brassicae]
MRMGSTSFELFKVGLYLTVPAGCVWMFNQEGHKKWWTSKEYIERKPSIPRSWIESTILDEDEIVRLRAEYKKAKQLSEAGRLDEDEPMTT